MLNNLKDRTLQNDKKCLYFNIGYIKTMKHKQNSTKIIVKLGAHQTTVSQLPTVISARITNIYGYNFLTNIYFFRELKR